MAQRHNSHVVLMSLSIHSRSKPDASVQPQEYVPPKPDNQNHIEGKANGYFAKGTDGDIYRYPEHAQGSWIDDAIIDFSNPDAVRWYTDQIRDLIAIGAATIKTDFAEGIPEDTLYHSIDGRAFHNLYSLVYNAIIFDVYPRYIRRRHCMGA